MSNDDVRLSVKGRLGVVVLDRPKALNALTLPMVQVLNAQLIQWERDPEIAAVVIRGAGDRAFCAGGDVRAVWDSVQARRRREGDGELARRFFAEEYRLNRRIKRYAKPYVALIDGITMGGGIGLSIHGSHRVTTERSLLAMPETAIGFVPDVGASHFLPRCPGEVGTYLGLTGARMGAADAHQAGLATHHVAAADLDAVVDALADAPYADPAEAHDVVSATLGRLAAPLDVKASPLARNAAAIDRCFAHDSVEAIITHLEWAAREAESAAWAMETLAALARLSPTALKVTLRELRRGRGLSIEEALVMEYRLSQNMTAGPDFLEGIRAVLVDKDRNPRWSAATLEEVDEQTVASQFLAPAEGDLTFTA